MKIAFSAVTNLDVLATFKMPSSEDVINFHFQPEFTIELPETPIGTVHDFGWLDTGVMVRGSDTHDRIFGTGWNDQIAGGKGHDLIAGDGGQDRLAGEAGDDRLYGGDDNDWLHGGADSDQLDGEAGQDSLFGGSGDDLLVGGEGNDVLFGGSGNDRFAEYLWGPAGTGNDSIDGGLGHDIVSYSAVLADVSISSFIRADGVKVTQVEQMLADGSIETDTLINVEELHFGLCDTVFL